MVPFVPASVHAARETPNALWLCRSRRAASGRGCGCRHLSFPGGVLAMQARAPHPPDPGRPASGFGHLPFRRLWEVPAVRAVARCPRRGGASSATCWSPTGDEPAGQFGPGRGNLALQAWPDETLLHLYRARRNARSPTWAARSPRRLAGEGEAASIYRVYPLRAGEATAGIPGARVLSRGCRAVSVPGQRDHRHRPALSFPATGRIHPGFRRSRPTRCGRRPAAIQSTPLALRATRNRAAGRRVLAIRPAARGGRHRTQGRRHRDASRSPAEQGRRRGSPRCAGSSAPLS